MTPPTGLRPGLPGSAYGESRIEVTYRLGISAREAPALAQAIAYEQTVELPPDLVVDPLVNERVVGRVESIVQVDENVHDACISFSAELANNHLMSLLNLIYGNASIYPGVRLQALSLPDSWLRDFQGPRYGVDGVRELVNVRHRPLLATAIKPRGAMSDYATSMVYQFALGGGDIVKDDQNLIDDFDTFRWRVAACTDAVDRANDETGGSCLYFPHLSAPHHELSRYLEYAYQVGVKGILVCPLLLGLETTRGVLADYPLAVMAHPAMSGSYLVNADQGIEHGVMLGTLFRLAGADISIFPNAGGRFSFSSAACESIAHKLVEPLGTLAPSLPCPAGGMGFDDLESMVGTYGNQSVLLIGGALLGHSEHVAHSTQDFVARLDVLADRSASEVTNSERNEGVHATVPTLHRIAFNEGFEWTGRDSSPYKDGEYTSRAGTAFKGVRRVELVGKFGERTACDLRYFEVAPGGFTSHEFHVHTHIVIGARGEGLLTLDDDERAIRLNDVAYIAPLQPHQLRNAGDEPFGFYCIVDHDRDRPVRIETGAPDEGTKHEH